MWILRTIKWSRHSLALDLVHLAGNRESHAKTLACSTYSAENHDGERSESFDACITYELNLVSEPK